MPIPGDPRPRSNGVRHNRIQQTASRAGVAFVIIGVLGVANELTGAGGVESGFLATGLTAAHVVFGLAGISMARSDVDAHTFLVDWGTAYFAVWSCAVVVSRAGSGDFRWVGAPLHWIPVVLGAVMVVVGLSGAEPDGASPCDRRRSG